MLNLNINLKMKEIFSEFTQALSTAHSSGDRAHEAEILNDIGNLFEMQDKNVNALRCYTEAMEIDNQIGNREGEGIELYNIGIVYLKLGLMTEALQMFQQSLAIAEDLDQLNLIEKRLTQIEHIYHLQGDTDKELRIHREMNIITDMKLLPHRNQNDRNQENRNHTTKNQLPTRRKDRIF